MYVLLDGALVMIIFVLSTSIVVTVYVIVFSRFRVIIATS
jgi:hypothetical protein